MKWCLEAGPFSKDKVKEAVRRGNEMLRQYKSIGAAARRLREVRHEVEGNALGGLTEEDMCCMEEAHKEYLREMAQEGVPVRRLQKRKRLTNHHCSRTR